MPVTATDPMKIFFAILLPPLGVFLEVDFKGHFWWHTRCSTFILEGNGRDPHQAGWMTTITDACSCPGALRWSAL